MRIKIFALFLLTAVMAGCLRENFAEKEQVLTLPELSSVTLEAEVLGEDSVYDTVVTQIRSTTSATSWSEWTSRSP